MATGTIKAIKDSYGFIRRGGGLPDLFFHRLDLVDLVFSEQLTEQRVQFEEIASERGPRAARVRPCN